MAKKVITPKTVPVLPPTTDPMAIYGAMVNGFNQPQVLPSAGAYNKAVTGYNMAQNDQYLMPDALRAYLGQVSPVYTQNRQDVLNTFSDPKSALYISNPFARIQAADQLASNQKSTYGEILDKTSRLLGLGLSQKQQSVAALQSQLQSEQASRDAQRQALQQQFSNAMTLRADRRASANANRTTTPSYGTAYLYDSQGKQIGIGHINPKNPTDVIYTDLVGNSLSEIPVGSRLGSVSYQAIGTISTSDVAGDYGE